MHTLAGLAVCNPWAPVCVRESVCVFGTFPIRVSRSAVTVNYTHTHTHEKRVRIRTLFYRLHTVSLHGGAPPAPRRFTFLLSNTTHDSLPSPTHRPLLLLLTAFHSNTIAAHTRGEVSFSDFFFFSLSVSRCSNTGRRQSLT